VSRALPFVGLAIRLGAAGIWLVAGAAKLADLERFRVQVQAYKILPGGLEAPFAYALPLVEVALGIYLAVGLLVRPAAILACALMVVFIAAQSQAWARGLSLDCGCFGSLAHQTVGLASVLRDAALGLPSLVLAVWPARFFSLDRRLLGRPDPYRLRA
jgi:uncharacterized membrane protein YphA (DoxX/SURF4 family)